MEIESVIPIMTSSKQDGFESSATSGSATTSSWRAFDGKVTPVTTPADYYRSSVQPRLPEYLSITFPEELEVGAYKITLGVGHLAYANMKRWEFEALVNGEWIVLHEYENEDPSTPFDSAFTFSPVRARGIRVKCLEKHGRNSWGVDELKVSKSIFTNKYLIISDNQAYTEAISGTWENVGAIPTDLTERETFYETYGMEEITREQLRALPVAIPNGRGKVSVLRI